MKNAIILHGSGNDHTGNWFPWLKVELKKKGYKVWVPHLPNSDEPNKEVYLKTIFANKEWKFDSDSVMIGHSSGAAFILRLLEKVPPEVKINEAILVAPPINMGTMPQYYVYKESMVKGSFDWEKIKESCAQFYFICSDKDPYDCGEDQSKIAQKHLGGKIILKKGEGHFNIGSNPKYDKFPLILDLLS